MGTARRMGRPRGARWPLALVPATVLAVVLAGTSAVGLEPEPTPSPSPTPSVVTPTATLPPVPVAPATPAAPDTPPPPSSPEPGTASPTPATTPAAGTGVTTTDAGIAAAQPALVAAVPGSLVGAGLALATIPAPGADAVYLPVGTDVTDARPFQVLRVDVLVTNPDTTAPHTWTPQLEYRRAGDEAFAPVPTIATPGVPVHTTHEWVRTAAGTEAGPATTTLDVAHLPAPQGLAPALGTRASGPNPDALRTVEPGTAVEQEFTVALSIDAAFGGAYELRVTDAGTPVTGLAAGRVVLGADPGVALSEGQRAGVPIASTTSEFPLVAPPKPGVVRVLSAGTSVHQSSTGQCASCHSAHRGGSQALISAPTQTAQCYTCHGSAGMGGPADVATQFSGGKTNDPATRTYYSHDLTAPGHRLESDAEFAGVLNRHAQCADCHNPHDVTAAPTTYANSTWTPSGSYGTSGVAVTNGAAGTAPTYTWLNGRSQPITAEYQLCLSCHSGYTQQLPNDPAHPSRDRTDLGVAFNPANPSYHPIEAPGRNQTAKLAESLAGTSPYKLWDAKTTDTIRCTMCHTGGATEAGTAPSAILPAHASANRGILVRPYESRVLSTAGRAYEPAAFALCLSCHAEAPFANASGDGARAATNFMFHGLHTTGIDGMGAGGTDIDVAGAGQGNARCAECHFRSHSTTDAVPGQDITGEGLVSFGPNVLPSAALGGNVTFTKTPTGGTCTLTCHGKDHRGVTYGNN